MPLQLVVPGYTEGFVLGVGQLQFDTELIADLGGRYNSVIPQIVQYDVQTSLGITIEQFASCLWRLDIKHDVTNYTGSTFYSALGKYNLGVLCICSSGAVVEEIYLNYEVQATGKYASYCTYPQNPYPNPNLIATDFAEVAYIVNAIPYNYGSESIGDEFYIRLQYPSLLSQFVCNYSIYYQFVEVDTIGASNLLLNI